MRARVSGGSSATAGSAGLANGSSWKEMSSKPASPVAGLHWHSVTLIQSAPKRMPSYSGVTWNSAPTMCFSMRNTSSHRYTTGYSRPCTRTGGYFGRLGGMYGRRFAPIKQMAVSGSSSQGAGSSQNSARTRPRGGLQVSSTFTCTDEIEAG